MNSSVEIMQELRKAMEFYMELGFGYLPVKEFELTDLSSVRNDAVCTDSKIEQQYVPVEAGQDRAGRLESLREEIGDCQRCKLCQGRKNIVFGEGSPEAALMFIGEGPGRDEDIQARPFVGDAGKLLTNMIIKLGLKRENVYIGNIVKCRPPNNRNPEEDEISACLPFIERQIKIIGPRVIVCLGKVSASALLKVNTPISRLRGNFSRYGEILVMPTFHPAYLLRNPKDKWLTWDDMQKVLEKLN